MTTYCGSCGNPSNYMGECCYQKKKKRDTRDKKSEQEITTIKEKQ